MSGSPIGSTHWAGTRRRVLLPLLVIGAALVVLLALISDRSLRVVSIGDSVTYDADPGLRV